MINGLDVGRSPSESSVAIGCLVAGRRLNRGAAGLSRRGFSPISARPGGRARRSSQGSGFRCAILNGARRSEVPHRHHQGLACLIRPPSGRRYCATPNLALIRQPWSRPASRRSPIATCATTSLAARRGCVNPASTASARVAVALPSGADGALAIVATACAAVAVPIDTQLTAPEIDERLALLRPRAVIVPADGPSAARDVAIGPRRRSHRGRPRTTRQARPESERSRDRRHGGG